MWLNKNTELRFHKFWKIGFTDCRDSYPTSFSIIWFGLFSLVKYDSNTGNTVVKLFLALFLLLLFSPLFVLLLAISIITDFIRSIIKIFAMSYKWAGWAIEDFTKAFKDAKHD